MAASGDDPNALKILVATDCHLGYAEKDAIRGSDSFTTFREILELAKSADVSIALYFQQ
jgi:double-strand break repair protein MRE11